MLKPLIFCGFFPQVEKRMPGALPSELREQDALGAVKHCLRIESASAKCGCEIIVMPDKRHSSGCTHKSIVRVGSDQYGIGIVTIGCKVCFLIGQIALIQIGPFPKYRYPQGGDQRYGLGNFASRQGTDDQV